MKHKVAYTILIISLIIVATFSPTVIRAYTKPLYPLMFLGATWSTSDGKTPYPNTIATCLLYTSDAADDGESVDLGGRRIITKKTSSQ